MGTSWASKPLVRKVLFPKELVEEEALVVVELLVTPTGTNRIRPE